MSKSISQNAQICVNITEIYSVQRPQTKQQHTRHNG